MTPEEMLDTVAEHGENAGGDHNVGLDGWFGFTIHDGDVLIVTWTPANEDGAADGAEQTRRWRLTPIDDTPQEEN